MSTDVFYIIGTELTTCKRDICLSVHVINKDFCTDLFTAEEVEKVAGAEDTRETLGQTTRTETRYI